MVMPRPRKKYPGLPPRMVPRQWRDRRGRVHVAYYYQCPPAPDGRRTLIPLGTDLVRAKVEWAKLENTPQHKAGLSAEDFSLEAIYTRYMAWAENTPASKLSRRTLHDRMAYWRVLGPVFGKTHIDALLPEHFLRYFDARSSKVRAKKEVKFVSVLCNWARARGWMRAPNPVEGLLRQMPVEEGRDVYVSDALYWLVYNHADPLVRDCMDLALLCGLRPTEALTLKWADLHKSPEGGEELWVKMPKTSKSGVRIKRIRVTGPLKLLLERIRARDIVGQTILCDEEGQRILLQGKFRYRFHQARAKAKETIERLTAQLGRAAMQELGLEWFPFQFRDLRPKAATDKERKAGMAETRRFLGHTTEKQTADYVRERVGELVDPVSLPEGIEKVLSQLPATGTDDRTSK